jgi:hypothetical protein
MQGQFEKNLDKAASMNPSRWTRIEQLGFGCNECHHELAEHTTPMPEAERKRLARKRRNASALIVVGVILIICALFIILPKLASGAFTDRLTGFSIEMVTIYMMLTGIMSVFVGISAWVFGYKTQEEQIEGD